MTIIITNISNLTYAPTFTGDGVPMFYDTSGISNACLSGDNMFSLECVYNQICPQFNSYFIKMGIIIIIAYLLMTWFLWWFLNYRYSKKPSRFNIINKIYSKFNYITETTGFIKVFGDLKDIDQRIFLDGYIRNKMLKLAVGFIAVVVWLSINMDV